VTLAFLGGAFYVTYRTGNRMAPSKLMRLNKIMLWTATVVVVFFLVFPQALSELFATDTPFTDDMQKTVLAIEGMT